MGGDLLLWVNGQGAAEDRDLTSLRQALAAVADVFPIGEEELSGYLDDHLEPVAGAVIAPSVVSPVTVARRIMGHLPGREVIFVTGGDGGKASRPREINQAFLYGHHRLIDSRDRDEAVQVVERLLRQANRQRRFRSVLTRMNEQLASPRREMALKRRLAISDRLLASILTQSPDSLLALDLDGYVLACNSALARTFAMEQAEGKHLNETPLAKRLPQLRELVKRAQATGQPCHEEMPAGRHKESGEITDLEVSATPVVDERNDLIGITVLLRDVSRLKHAERELRRLNMDLEQRVDERTRELQEANEKMEAFLYSVAHDLRSPVRSIRGFSEVIIGDFGEELPEEALDLLQRIFKAAGRMDFLILDLLAYSRTATVKLSPETIDLDEVVAAANAGLHAEISTANADVRVEAPLGKVRAHQTTLEQAVTNLVANALRYSKPNRPPSVRMFSKRQGEHVRLWIEDDGIGIDPKHHARIFQVFERLDAATDTPGTGVGLAIVKIGIERMGGRVGVESAPGKGSRFWIELPAAP